MRPASLMIAPILLLTGILLLPSAYPNDKAMVPHGSCASEYRMINNAIYQKSWVLAQSDPKKKAEYLNGMAEMLSDLLYVDEAENGKFLPTLLKVAGRSETSADLLLEQLVKKYPYRDLAELQGDPAKKAAFLELFEHLRGIVNAAPQQAIERAAKDDVFRKRFYREYEDWLNQARPATRRRIRTKTDQNSTPTGVFCASFALAGAAWAGLGAWGAMPEITSFAGAFLEPFFTMVAGAAGAIGGGIVSIPGARTIEAFQPTGAIDPKAVNECMMRDRAFFQQKLAPRMRSEMEALRDRILANALRLEQDRPAVALEAVRSGTDYFDRKFLDHVMTRFKKTSTDEDLLSFQAKIAHVLEQIVELNEHTPQDGLLTAWLKNGETPELLKPLSPEELRLVKLWIKPEAPVEETRETLKQMSKILATRPTQQILKLTHLQETRALDRTKVHELHDRFRSAFQQHLARTLGRKRQEQEYAAAQAEITASIDHLLKTNEHYYHDQFLSDWAKLGESQPDLLHSLLIPKDKTPPIPELKQALIELKESLEKGPFLQNSTALSSHEIAFLSGTETLPKLIDPDGIQKLHPQNSLHWETGSPYFYGTEVESFVPSVAIKVAALNQRVWAINDAILRFVKESLKAPSDPETTKNLARNLDYFSHTLRQTLTEFKEFDQEITTLDKKMQEYVVYGQTELRAPNPEFALRLTQLEQARGALQITKSNGEKMGTLLGGLQSYLSSFQTAILAKQAHPVLIKNSEVSRAAKQVTKASEELTQLSSRNLKLQ